MYLSLLEDYIRMKDALLKPFNIAVGCAILLITIGMVFSFINAAESEKQATAETVALDELLATLHNEGKLK